MEITPADLPYRQVYKLMTATIVPRPIAWVSTVNADGQPNLAPFSYFTAVCALPPTIVFCPGIRGVDNGQKDTYNNIRATGEFIVNFVTESLAAAMNITAAELPAGVNEFARAGLTAEAGRAVNVPRVAESPAAFECRLHDIITVSERPGGGHLVLGTIVHMHFDDSVYREGDSVDIEAYRPVGRLSGSGYCRVNDFFELVRPPREISPKN